MKKLKVLSILLTFVLAISALAACGSGTKTAEKQTEKPAATAAGNPTAKPTDSGQSNAEWDKVLQAAKGEELVVGVHTAAGALEFIEKFKQAYPSIKVKGQTLKVTELAPRVISEQRNKQYLWDIFIGPTANMMTVLEPAGALTSMDPFLAPIDPKIKDDSNWGGGFNLFLDNATRDALIYDLNEADWLVVNRDMVPESELSSSKQLLDPKWKKKMVVYDPSSPSAGSKVLTKLMQLHGEDYIKKLLKDQDLVISTDRRSITEWVATGRYPIALGIDPDILKELQKTGVGKKVESLGKGENKHIETWAATVFKNAPNPNATKVFLGWFLSKAGQEAWVTSTQTGQTRRLDVKYDRPGRIDFSQYKAGKDLIFTTKDSAIMINRLIELLNSK